MSVDAVSRFLAVLAVVAGGGGIALLLARRHPAVAPLRRHALAAAAAGTAMAGSLWYSEVAGFLPCELCWWQRLAMYPLAVLLTLAAVRRDDAVRPYARVLAGGGLLVSVWHVAVQRVPAVAGTTSCSAEAPCSLVWVDVGGVLTIPTMAACGFLGVLALLSLPRDLPVTSQEGPVDRDRRVPDAPTAVTAEDRADVAPPTTDDDRTVVTTDRSLT